MVRSRRSISKEDASSVLADSGISLSSPPANQKRFPHLNEDEEQAILDELCVTDDDSGSDLIELDNVEKVVISDNDESQPEFEYKDAAYSEREDSSCKSVTGEPSSKRPRKSYTCDVCLKEFRGKSDLTRHKFIHTAERPYKCELCGNCYRQEVNLKNHITSAHKKIKEFACRECPKTFALKERLRLHMRVHTGEKPYECKQCDKRFARGGQLNQHMVSHHQDAPKQFKCEKCSSRFSTPANLKAHMQGHEETPDCFCEICREHFANDVLLKAHTYKMHYKLKQMDCEICQRPIEENDLVEHMKIHSNTKTHVCEICNSVFMQKSQYNVHMRMHTGERPFQCRICCQTFAHSSVLKLHVRKHTGEKPFNCLLCKDDEVAFSQLAHLKTHMKKIHKQLKPYMCEGCQDFFKVKLELDVHQRECKKCSVSVEQQQIQHNETQTLSHIRFLMAILLKKISSEQKLQQLGFEKRLIDNVVIAALKLAKRKASEDLKLSHLERMRMNVEEFLNWIVPPNVMEKFKEEKLETENILEKIVSMYMKQK
ncbi:zinc finger protein 420 [Stomoxys calcitrans]|uniref:zinc finger protein 420 n=1 Tax=Stomoxys calcitrans TaxID=35570 RepID=UPI0027E32239|nr:zinc finger protein 420 [Stomoxys calcitrans]XP_013119208.2 zinc finger protein 420 [Stomoxys calcitrans]